MAIARHKHMTLIFITQHGGTLNLNPFRQADTLIFKEPSLLQRKTERSFLQEVLHVVEDKFQNVPKQDRISSFYIFDDDFEGLAKFNLPSFWSNEISEAWAKWSEEKKDPFDEDEEEDIVDQYVQ